jgi:aldose 1-epimerase
VSNLMTKPTIQQDAFHGEKAIKMNVGPYEATVLPEKGGTLISFMDVEKDYHFIRDPRPDQMEHFKTRPFEYGIPVLFPPNRYDKGTFRFQGKTYQFPVNEKETNNHLHGFLYDLPWSVSDNGSDEEECYVVLKQVVDEESKVYQYFPHTFIMEITYTLSTQGLTQKVNITNDGSEPMPCMLAFHTAFKVPFASHSALKDYRTTITIGERWQLNERMLPTGKYQPLNEEEEKLKTTGSYPYFEPMDNHYTAYPQNGRNYMTLTDTREKVKLVYDVGLNYKYWMVWNNRAEGEYICPEPQTNLVNAPNVHLPTEETGIIVLKAGESWSETSRIYIENIT